MALIRANSGSGGNPITLDDLSFTGKTLIHTISTASASWTATEDCIMGGTMKGATDSSAIAYFNNASAFWTGNGASGYIGMASSSDTSPTTYGIFVPKGTVVTTRNSGTYNLKFYSLS